MRYPDHNYPGVVHLNYGPHRIYMLIFSGTEKVNLSDMGLHRELLLMRGVCIQVKQPMTQREKVLLLVSYAQPESLCRLSG